MIGIEMIKALKYFYYLGFIIGIFSNINKTLVKDLNTEEMNKYIKVISLTSIYVFFVVEVIYYVISKIYNQLNKIYSQMLR